MNQKPEETKNEKFHTKKENIPQKIQETPRWILWKEEKRGDKLTKQPIAPWKYGGKYKYRASATEPENWTDFETARGYAEKKEEVGLGFCFSTEDNIVGIDLDDCVNENGKIEDWALDIINEANSYTEISPGGNGIHILLRGGISEAVKNNEEGVEIYDRDRFFTVTGRKSADSPKILREKQDLLDELEKEMGGKTTAAGKRRKENEFEPRGTEANLSCMDLVDTDKFEKVGKHYKGPHPVHGSHTGTNLAILPKDNTWFCHHTGHNSGGGPFELLAVKEGILNCGEWERGDKFENRNGEKVKTPLVGKKWVETVETAQRKGLISEEEAVELDGGKRKGGEVLRTVDLTELGRVRIGFSDLYQKANATRGSLHIWLDSDQHHFEEDRKLSNQNIKQFIRDGIEIYNLEEKHEAKLYKKFATLKDEAREEAAKETAGLENDGVEKEELDVEEEDVYEILEGEPLIELQKRTDKIHKGDPSLKMLAWISGLSRSVLDYPINLWPVGTTGAGKTHLFETMSRAIPSEFMLKFDACSPKSMYYFCREYGEDALDGKIAFFNEVEASDEAKVLLRGLTDPTKEQNRLLTVEEQQMLEININGLPVTWFTSVNPLEDEELKNRFLFCNPEESKNHKNDVAEHQMKYIREGILQPIKIIDFPELKAAFREIVETVKDKQVLVPYKWDWGIKEEARLQPFFGAIVMAMAKIHHRNRPQTDEYIIATLEDFYLAKLIFRGVVKETLGGVKDKDLEIYEILGESKQGWKSRADIAEVLGISTGQARYRGERLVDSGLVNSQKSDGVWYYWKSQKEVVKPVVSISTGSLATDKLMEFLEEKEITCEEIRYTEARWGVAKAIRHLPPRIIQNFSQAINIRGEDLEKVFNDYKGVKLDFTGNTGKEKANEAEETKQRDLKVDDGELKEFIEEENPKPEEISNHFDDSQLLRVNEILDLWKEEGFIKLDAHKRWKWVKKGERGF